MGTDALTHARTGLTSFLSLLQSHTGATRLKPRPPTTAWVSTASLETGPTAWGVGACRLKWRHRTVGRMRDKRVPPSRQLFTHSYARAHTHTHTLQVLRGQRMWSDPAFPGTTVTVTKRVSPL